MPEFQYLAKNQSGTTVSGRLIATDRHDALRSLVERSLAPMTLKELRAKWTLSRRVPGIALAGIYTRLADLVHAGVPLLRALDLIVKRQKNPRLAEALVSVRNSVADGASLAEACRSHATIFGELPTSIIQAGEEGGFLEDALRRVATFAEQSETLKRKILGALAYPMFLVCTGTLVLIGMMVFFVPKFSPIFSRLQQKGELPVSTQMLLTSSELLKEHYSWIVLLLAVVGFSTHRILVSQRGRRCVERYRTKLFLIGPLSQQIALSRFCRVLGILLRNDVPLLQSLRIAKNSTGSVLLKEVIENATRDVTEGKSLTNPLEASGQFSDELIEIISVGEDANNLDHVLLDAADSMDRRTQQQLDLLVRLLEPALLLVMATIILFFLMALLLPVFQTAHSLT